MLVFIALSHKSERGQWAIYQCGCGNYATKLMTRVKDGTNKSCGCMRSDLNRLNDPLHKKIRGMIQRCHNPGNPKYKYYGERGIKVCDEWRQHPTLFKKWALENGWKPGLQIDRINNDNDYEPNNCRFVTPAENIRNSRHAKLSVREAKEIRQRLSQGEASKLLAAEFSVTVACINDIRRHRTWRLVEKEG